MGLSFGHIGIRENRMETTIEGLGFRIQGFRVGGGPKPKTPCNLNPQP